MKLRIILIVSISLISIAVDVAGGGLVTKNAVSNILIEFQNAVDEKDVDKMSQLIAKDAVFEITEITPKGEITEVWNVDQYLEGTKLTWKMVKNYSYKVLGKNIKISADEKSAFVTDTTIESGEMFGEKFESTTNEEITIKNKAGKLIITKIIARTKIKL